MKEKNIPLNNTGNTENNSRFSGLIDSEKLAIQQEYFKNRLLKRQKHLEKWAKKNSLGAYRVYNKDIPEIPLSVDVYTDFNSGKKYGVVFLYKRPYKTDEKQEEVWMNSMLPVISQTLSIQDGDIFCKLRQKQRGTQQYEKMEIYPEQNNVHNARPRELEIIVREGCLNFKVKPQVYLDTGLFLDHKILRKKIFDEAENKKILNLFCYTGSFSVYGAAGGGKLTSVDISNTYLNWAKENFTLNNLNPTDHEFIREDVFLFLKKALEKHLKWDLIILDPPTFSNSKKMKDFLDINRHWPVLCASCLLLLNSGGTLYFSTNSKKLKFSDVLLYESLTKLSRNKFGSTLKIDDCTDSTIPEDFKGSRIHRVWKITVSG